MEKRKSKDPKSNYFAQKRSLSCKAILLDIKLRTKKRIIAIYDAREREREIRVILHLVIQVRVYEVEKPEVSIVRSQRPVNRSWIFARFISLAFLSRARGVLSPHPRPSVHPYVRTSAVRY